MDNSTIYASFRDQSQSIALSTLPDLSDWDPQILDEVVAGIRQKALDGGYKPPPTIHVSYKFSGHESLEEELWFIHSCPCFWIVTGVFFVGVFSTLRRLDKISPLNAGLGISSSLGLVGISTVFAYSRGCSR